MLDANGVEHTIQAMQHGYVQCSRPGEAGCRNYRRRELQLQHDGAESRSSASGEDDEGSSSDNASNREGDPEDAGMAVEEPDQDSSDEL